MGAALYPVLKEAQPKIDVANMNFYYGDNRVLQDVTVKMQPNYVTALIGPSGCGKSTLLRTFNRMNDLIPGAELDLIAA